MSSFSDGLSRREVVSGGLTGAAMLIGAKSGAVRTYRANSKLRLGVVGVGNRGGANLAGVSSEEITALCDVDGATLRTTAAQWPAARTYTDWRRMLDAGHLDGVVVSTPDHHHALVTVRSLRMGLPVYCEKPLTHTVEEARAVTDAAARAGRATQLGTQIHAGSNYRRVVEAVRSGVIGSVSEVHVWVGGGYRGGDRPLDTPAVPGDLDWDTWLGPAPVRPYHRAYAPFAWRGWWDFGGGTLGDMACHHMDLPFWALRLGTPRTIDATGPQVHRESTPPWLTVRYTFPRDSGPETVLTWYNGPAVPEAFRATGVRWGSGTLLVGSKGQILADYDRHVLLPRDQFAGWVPPAPSIPESIGHHAEWILACKTGSATTCDFAYSGPLTEAVLLGNVAFRTQRRLDWNVRALRARSTPEADEYIRKDYRKGWTL